MDQIIKVINENNQLTVLARDLHEFLELGTKFNDWFKRMLKYGFDENIDYVAVTQKKVTAQGNKSEYIDYQLTLDMAKEISMIQRNEKGKQARRYFIETEKKYQASESRLLEMVDKRLSLMENQVSSLQKELKVLKIESGDTEQKIEDQKLYSVTEVAEAYGMDARNFNTLLRGNSIIKLNKGNRWRLNARYDGKGYAVIQGRLLKWTDTGVQFLEKRLGKFDFA